MKKRCEPGDWDALRDKVIGLGEQSHKKSHYALLRDRLLELERFRHLLDASDEIILVVAAASGLIIDANGGACRRLGLSRERLLGRALSDFCACSVQEFADQLASDAGQGRHVSLRMSGEDRRPFATEGSVVLEFVDGAPLISLVVQDVTVLKGERDRSQLYLDTVQSIMVALDENGFITMLNPFGYRLLGYPAGTLLGRHWFTTCLPQPEANRTVVPYFEQLIRGGSEALEYFENHVVTASGERLLVAWHNAVLRDHGGQVVGTLSAGEDITERRASEEALHNLAFFDPLTGLPNRRLLLDRLQHCMAGSVRNRNYQALLFLDLDQFKTLNDTQGHEQGDRLLVETARRLERCVRAGDTVSRMGGDEFVLLLEQLSADETEAATQAEAVGEKILTELGAPYEFGKEAHRGTASIGVTLFEADEMPVEDLLKRADLAMYQAKASGRNTMRFFDPAMQAAVTARARTENGLRRAVAAREFVLYYQPQVDAGDACIGVEALLRWRDPARGFILPGEFIGLAEETGLILPIGRWVMREAFAQLAEWQRSPDTAHLSVAVNICASQFRLPTFVGDVRALIDASGVDPAGLKLELTESTLVADVEDVIAKMSALKRSGVTFALDDFGTGYSSLAYVKRLPLDQIKIDQSFVRDVLVDPNDAAICRAVIGLGHSLGLQTIAEGVETAGQSAFLKAEGCGGAQGYFYAPAMSSQDLTGWLGQRCAGASAAPG
ncbi:MAG: putative bifunctional diguanylate cyclase/phosphodiesterase [Ignavibacteria bacterium]